MLIEPAILKYSEYTAGTPPSIGASYHVGGEIYKTVCEPVEFLCAQNIPGIRDDSLRFASSLV